MKWQELMEKQPKTETEQILIQCIATISSHPGYSHMTPDEIFEAMCESARQIQY